MDIDVERDVISDMAVSINLCAFKVKGSCRAPLKGFGVDIRQV